MYGGTNWLTTAGVLAASQGFYATLAAAGNAALQVIVSGDSTNRFVLGGDGAMQWGPGNGAMDTKLYRYAGGYLRTDQSLMVGSNLFGYGWVYLRADSARILFGAADDANLYRYAANILQTDGRLIVKGDGSFALHIEANASGGPVYPIYYRIAGDSQPRFLMDNGGSLQWGPGGSAPMDVILSRQQANTLRVQSADLWVDRQMVVGLGLSTAAIYLANNWNCYLQGRASDGLIQTSGQFWVNGQLSCNGGQIIGYQDVYARLNNPPQVFMGDMSTMIGGQPTNTLPSVVFGTNADVALYRDTPGRLITFSPYNTSDHRVRGSSLPRFSINASGNGVDQKKWQWYVDASGNLVFGALNDAENGQGIVLTLGRGGTVSGAFPGGGGDAAWTSVGLASGWAWANGAYAPPRVRKSSGATVNFQGMIAWQGGGADPGGPTTICTLPVGYRPAYILICNATAAGNVYGTSARIDIAPDGTVSWIASANSNNFLAWNISFQPDQ
jgi:hypothetical protein